MIMFTSRGRGRSTSPRARAAAAAPGPDGRYVPPASALLPAAGPAPTQHVYTAAVRESKFTRARGAPYGDDPAVQSRAVDKGQSSQRKCFHNITASHFIARTVRSCVVFTSIGEYSRFDPNVVLTSLVGRDLLLVGLLIIYGHLGTFFVGM